MPTLAGDAITAGKNMMEDMDEPIPPKKKKEQEAAIMWALALCLTCIISCHPHSDRMRQTLFVTPILQMGGLRPRDIPLTQGQCRITYIHHTTQRSHS